MSPDGTMTAGILRGIDEGWFMAEIAEASFAYQRQLEKGEKKVVGVNCHTDTVESPVEILRVSHEVERAQVRELATRRSDRDQAAVDAGLAAMVQTARSGGNMIPPMIAAALAEATLGEICGALRDEWGSYTEAPAF
jgi:methylmalonyl-CoA mutase N-terminal domain/subunit